MSESRMVYVTGPDFGYPGGIAPPLAYGQQPYPEMMGMHEMMPVQPTVPAAQPAVAHVLAPAPAPAQPVTAQPVPQPAPAQPSPAEKPNIVLPPATVSKPPASVQDPPQKQVEVVVQDVSRNEQQLDACCVTPIAFGCLGFVGIPFFVIFVTVTCVMIYGSGRQFCNDYWKTEIDPTKSYQMAGFSIVGVWALIMGTTIFVLGFLWFFENRAAVLQARALRDQLRTLIMFTSIFGFAWLACGNVWVIGRPTSTYSNITMLNGMIPDDCKNGKMGDNQFYWFCYIIIVILDILAPLSMFYAGFRTLLNKTFIG